MLLNHFFLYYVFLLKRFELCRLLHLVLRCSCLMHYIGYHSLPLFLDLSLFSEVLFRLGYLSCDLSATLLDYGKSVLDLDFLLFDSLVHACFVYELDESVTLGSLVLIYD